MGSVWVQPGHLEASPQRAMTAADRASIAKLERKYPWLANCRRFWGGSTDNRIPSRLQIEIGYETIAHVPELCSVQVGDGRLGYGWSLGGHPIVQPWVPEFVSDVLTLLGPSAEMTSSFSVSSDRGDHREQWWKATLDHEGSVQFHWEDEEEEGEVPFPKLPAPKQTGKNAAHEDGVRQAWVISDSSVLSLGVQGDFKIWNSRTGRCLRTLSLPRDIRAAEVIGQRLVYVLESGKWGVYDIPRNRAERAKPLPKTLRRKSKLTLSALGDSHFVIDDEQRQHVFGPFALASKSSQARVSGVGLRAESGVFAGSSLYIGTDNGPVEVALLSRRKEAEFDVDEDDFLDFSTTGTDITIAGNTLVTFYGCELHLWNVKTRTLRSVNADIHYEDESGDIECAFGFASGRVLTWGESGFLWSARTARTIRTLDGPVPTSAFEVGSRRLVTWTNKDIISSWSVGHHGAPRMFRTHSEGFTGACHLSGSLILSWSKEDPALRIWNAATGKYVKALGA